MLIHRMLLPAPSLNFTLSVQNFFTFQALKILKSLPKSALTDLGCFSFLLLISKLQFGL